jgi:hypothetical protein
MSPFDASYHKSVCKFQVFGCQRWATSSFCGDLEVVLAFLFPDRFEVEVDQSWKDCDDATYLLRDKDGARLDKRLAAEFAFASRIREIKHHVVSTLSDLCADQLELSYGRDAAEAAIIDY